MTRVDRPAPPRAVVAGLVCLAILGGMIVGHAWPLWTGRDVTLAVVPVDPRDMFRGEFVRLTTRLEVLDLDGRASADGSAVTPAGKWWGSGTSLAEQRGSVVFVQLEPDGATGEWRAVSVSRSRIDDAINLRGRIRWNSGTRLQISYGLDAFFMQEGTARPVEDAVRAGGRVQMLVAIASSGRARIRNLIVDGTPLPKAGS